MLKRTLLIYLFVLSALTAGPGLADQEEGLDYIVRQQDFTKYLTFTGELQAVNKVSITVQEIGPSAANRFPQPESAGVVAMACAKGPQ